MISAVLDEVYAANELSHIHAEINDDFPINTDIAWLVIENANYETRPIRRTRKKKKVSSELFIQNSPFYSCNIVSQVLLKLAKQFKNVEEIGFSEY
ncbi:Hypothetical protein CINCED_3A025690 [Cinara cedri]|uniref:Uncharacterized protein n=1 Tax=Cinara cedri TaxID=506608 RepID=A0A5E4MF13_9HEMI|nr:Hypothetical protein CINCED_3A025690 [Cinara cedri]